MPARTAGAGPRLRSGTGIDQAALYRGILFAWVGVVAVLVAFQLHGWRCAGARSVVGRWVDSRKGE